MINIQHINSAWSWTEVKAEELLDVNKFGNLIFRCSNDRIWRICPEELSINCIGKDAQEYLEMRSNKEFIIDWEMEILVDIAKEKYGALESDKVYCLKTPSVLGGKYELENIGAISLEELIKVSGDLANQIRDLPDGTQITLKVN